MISPKLDGSSFSRWITSRSACMVVMVWRLMIYCTFLAMPNCVVCSIFCFNVYLVIFQIDVSELCFIWNAFKMCRVSCTRDSGLIVDSCNHCTFYISDGVRLSLEPYRRSISVSLFLENFIANFKRTLFCVLSFLMVLFST